MPLIWKRIETLNSVGFFDDRWIIFVISRANFEKIYSIPLWRIKFSGSITSNFEAKKSFELVVMITSALQLSADTYCNPSS